MYRDSQQSFAQTIERLEREIAELHSVHAPPRPSEKALWAVTGLAVIGAILATVACLSAHARAEALQTRLDAAANRLEAKTQVLNECELTLSEQQHAAQQARIDAWQATTLTPPPAPTTN
jgi:hypothetical protein